MPDQKMLRQIMTSAEIYSHGEAIIDMLRDHYGLYDADSLEEVLVDDSFIQRLKAKGYELLAEGDPRAERGPQRRPLPRPGMSQGSRTGSDSGPRMPGRNGGPQQNRQQPDRNQSGANRGMGMGSSSSQRQSGNDGANGVSRPQRPGGGPFRSAPTPFTDRERTPSPAAANQGERERVVAGTATPVNGVPSAEVPELPVPTVPEVPPLPPISGERSDVEAPTSAVQAATTSGDSPTVEASPSGADVPALPQAVGVQTDGDGPTVQAAEPPAQSSDAIAPVPTSPAPATRSRATAKVAPAVSTADDEPKPKTTRTRRTTKTSEETPPPPPTAEAEPATVRKRRTTRKPTEGTGE